MILLYTGASMPNAPQINADKSLGGYVSSTGIPNGRLSNLFSLISKSDVLQNRSVIRMITLKNTTGGDVTNVVVYTNTTGGKVKLKLAAVAPALDANNNPVFETVFDSNTLPYQATLDYHEGVDNAIQAGIIADGAVIGIWILREIDESKFPELNTTLTGKELADLLEAAITEGEETVSLQIDYDIASVPR
jgi:hypothetical protein